MIRYTVTAQWGARSVAVSVRNRDGAEVEMIFEIHSHDGVFYVCDRCGFAYGEKAYAKRCQSWCRKHRSCSLDIIRHALFVT